MSEIFVPFGVVSLDEEKVFPVYPYDVPNVSLGQAIKIPRGIRIDPEVTNLLLSVDAIHSKSPDPNTCMPNWIVLAPLPVLQITQNYMEEFSSHKGVIGWLTLISNPELMPPQDCPDYKVLFETKKYHYFEKIPIIAAVFAGEEFQRQLVKTL